MRRSSKPWRDKLYINITRLFLIVLIPNVVLGAYSYLHAQRTAFDNATQTVNRQISYAVEEIDKRLTDLVAMRELFITNSELLTLKMKAQADADDTARMVNTYRLFANAIGLNGFLKDIVLYNGAEKVVSSSGVYPTGYYFTEYRCLEGYSLDAYRGLLSGRTNMRYMPPVEMTEKSLNRYTQYTVIPILSTVTLHEGRGILIFLVDAKCFMDVLREYIPFGEAYYAIEGEEGRIIADAQEDEKQKGDLSFAYVSLQNGWRYTVHIPQDIIIGTSQQMLRQVLIITASLLAFAVLLALRVGRHVYQPLNNIRKMLETEGPKELEGDSGSLERLEAQVAKMTENSTDAKAHFDALARTFAKEAFLSQTMTENKVSMLNTIMTKYLGFHGGPYQCAAVRFTKKQDERAEKTAQQVFSRYFPVCSIGYSEDVMLFVLETETIHGRALIETAVRELARRLPEEITGVAVGYEIASVQELHKSINASLTVLQRMQIGERCVLRFSEDFDISAQYEYTHKDEWILVESLARNESERLHHQLDNILLRNYEKCVSYQQIQHLFEQLRNTAYRYAQQEGMPIPPRIYDHRSSFDTLREELHQLYAILLTDADIKAQSTHLQLVQQADAYIADHYTEDIYLDTIAGSLHVSAKHLSKVYKQQQNINISDQLCFVRVEQAKELLKNSNLTITAIMHQTGFVSRATFLRSFKKYTGISPSIYRAMQNPSTEVDGGREA